MKTSSTLINTVCITFLLLLSSSAQQAYATSCTMDYECGVPYGQCSGSVNDCSTTFGGIAVDSSTGYIYYSTSCRSSTNDRSSNVTIKRVSADGGVPTTIYSEPTLQEGGNVAKVFTVVNGILYVQRVERMPGSNLVTFNLQSGAQQTVTLNPGFFQAQLDIKNGASYSCQLDFGSPNNYTIQRYSGVVGQTSSNNGITLYKLGTTQCGPVRRGNGNNIIITGITYTVSNTNQQQTVTYTTTFYRGSVAGNSSLPDGFFSVNQIVNDFVVDASGAIYYGTSTGLFKRVGQKTTTLNNEQVTGIAIYNNKIYYNNGFTIRSINEDGTNPTQVVQPATGTCTCRTGFSGSNCQSCVDGQIQWEGGFPYCVSLNAQGVPTSCTADYQCGNVPYTVCDFTCSCRANFTGSRCDQCAPPLFLSFVNGIPYCS